MATPCSTALGLQFQARIALDFEGGALTSDAGLIVLRELDERLGLTCGLAECLEDRRDLRYVEHSATELVRQRLYQIAAGYEDAVDANLLRRDPALQLVVRPQRPSAPLASQPTLSRLENRATWRDIAQLSRLSLSWFLRHGAHLRAAPSQEILLDADSTEDPTHGHQQLALFHGKYGTYVERRSRLELRRHQVLRPGEPRESLPWGGLLHGAEAESGGSDDDRRATASGLVARGGRRDAGSDGRSGSVSRAAAPGGRGRRAGGASAAAR